MNLMASNYTKNMKYEDYMNSLPGRRRKSGLKYDETHRDLPAEAQLKGREKTKATKDAMSEIQNESGKGYDAAFYNDVYTKRIEDNDNYYSIKELIEANRAFTSGHTPDIKRDPHNVLKFANLHLTTSQLTELQKSDLSDAKVLSPRMIVFGTKLKERLDGKGWTMKNVHAYGVDKEELRFTVQSGNNQIDIVGFTPQESKLGDFYTNGNSVFRSSHALARVNDGAGAANRLMPQIEYFMEGVDPSKFREFDVYASKRLTNATTVGMNAELKVDASGAKKRTNSGNTIDYDVSFNIGHNKPSKTKHRDLYNHQEIDRLLEPQSLTELIEQAYEKASLSSDENEVDSLIDLESIRLEDGSLDTDQVDMDVVIRNSDMTVLLRLVRKETERRLQQGEDIESIRSELLYGREGVASDVDDIEFDEDARNNGYDEDGMDVSEDNGVFVQQGSRDRIANLMVGMTDESGQSLSGWMDLDASSNKQDYEKALRDAKRAAQESGITEFEGRFDNDGVLHWSGVRGVTFDDNNDPVETIKVSHKVGQFFFPAREDEYDAEGNLVRKKGVMNLKRGNGKEDLRVDNFDVSFVPPTEKKSHILERIKITGLEHKMKAAIQSSIKSQVLTRTDDQSVERDELYDTTRINKAYEDMGRLDRERMLRPGVVEHLRTSFLIDKSYLDRDGELREESNPKYKEDIKKYAQPQSVRLPLKGLEGIYDAQASSDGGTLGLRGYFTEEFMQWIEENRGADGFRYDTTGQLGMLHLDNGQETALERWVTGRQPSRALDDVTAEIPNLGELDLTEDYKAFVKAKERGDKDAHENAFRAIYEKTRSHRFMYASPMVRRMRQNYAQYDSPDRVLMTAKMAEVSSDIIGGPLDKDSSRDRVRVALMSAGGLTFEDSIIVSKEFADAQGLKVGDKLADNHSNKGVVGYIAGLEEGHPAYNADVEQAFKDADASGYPIDMIQSPYGMTSRANMGLGKELIHSRDDRKGAILYQDGPNKGEVRGYAGEISVIVTNMDAEHKTNLYELQDLGRHRTFSYQQALALQSHGASKTLAHILGGSEKKHADLMQYENIIGYTTTEDNQLVKGHYGMQASFETYDVNGVPKQFEVLDEAKDILVVSSHDITENGLPKEASYMQLPISRDAYLKDDVSVDERIQTTHLPLLPERLRRETKAYDGEFVEHDYTISMNRIVGFSSQVEDLQMNYLMTYSEGLEDFRKELNDPELTTDKMQQLYDVNDEAFMRAKARYPFQDKLKKELQEAQLDDSREALSKKLDSDLKDYARLSRLLDSEVGKYQRSVEKDQFGIDHRSKKHSFVRRRIMSKEMRNSATAILTNDTSLELEEVGVSPALGLNAGVLEPIDNEKWEAALATNDPAKIHEAARGNWRVKEGTEGDNLMVWRDPVLHDGSVFAMKYRVDERLTGVAIHPMMTATMGADFDGDTFGVAYVDDKEVQKEWDEKLNVRYNMMDARNELAIINVGMDNVDYMKGWIEDESDKGFVAQIPWAQEKLASNPEYFNETNAKKVLNSYIAHLEDTTWEKVDDQFIELADQAGFDYVEYDELIKKGAVRKSEMPLVEQQVLETGEALYDDAYRHVIDTYTYDKVQELTDVTGKNAHDYRSRFVDITDDETLLESQRSMANDGAKGKLKDITARNESYLRKGVTPDNILSVRQAQKAKVDEIGRSGSQTLKVTPILADHTFYRGRRAISGATIGMDVTETASQSILQIKHSPDDVPAAKRFLKESPKLFEGHKEAFERSDEAKPVWVELSSNMLGKTADERNARWMEITGGDKPGPVEESAKDMDLRLARKMDQMLVKAYGNPDKPRRQSIYVDINHGVVTDRNPNHSSSDPEKLHNYYKGEERVDWKSNLLPGDKQVPIDGSSAYRLAMKTVFHDAGLDITNEEVGYYQSALREDVQSPRENAGLVTNYQRMMFENADTLDILAQHGADGLRNVSKWDKYNPDYPKLIAETQYSKPYTVDYKTVHTLVDKEYAKGMPSYEQQRELIQERKAKVIEMTGNQPADEKIVGDHTYKAFDYDNVDSNTNREFLQQLQSTNEPVKSSRTVAEQPVAKTAPAKPYVNPFDAREQAKQAVRANEEYTQRAVNGGRAADVSAPESEGSIEDDRRGYGIG